MSSFDKDLTNAKKLLDKLGTDHPKYLDTHTLFKRLEENISNVGLYGDTSDSAALRTQIRRELDKISLELYKCTTDALDATHNVDPVKRISTPPQPISPISRIRSDQKDSKSIFISHSSADDAFVSRLADDLTEAGMDVWHDGKDIKVSQSIPTAINHGLTGSDYFIIVLTPESVESPWVIQELDAALAGKKIILPALLRDCERPPLIQANKFADFRTDYDTGLNDLYEGLGIKRDYSSEKRRFEAAMAQTSHQTQRTEVRGMISLLDSIGLRGHLPDAADIEDITKQNVKSSPVPLKFIVDKTTNKLQDLNVLVSLTAPDFQVDQATKKVRIPPDGDSGVFNFLLTPVVANRRALVVLELFQDEIKKVLIGSVTLTTEIKSKYDSTAKAVWNWAAFTLGFVLPPASEVKSGVSENEASQKFIFRLIERACYNGDFSPAQEKTLKSLIQSIALKKQIGENLMSPANPENTGEMFAYASQVLIYDLLSLSDYHAEWPHLVVSDSFKKNSIKLLGKMKDQVMVSSALVQQVTRQDLSDDIEQVITPLQSLQTILRNIDDYLLSGKVPFHVRNEIERYFDDITFHLNKYLLLLHELADSSDPLRHIQ